jgi:hypothetical protein
MFMPLFVLFIILLLALVCVKKPYRYLKGKQQGQQGAHYEIML